MKKCQNNLRMQQFHLLSRSHERILVTLSTLSRKQWHYFPDLGRLLATRQGQQILLGRAGCPPAQGYPMRGTHKGWNSFFHCPGETPTSLRKKGIFLIVSLEWTLLYNFSAPRWLTFLISTKALSEQLVALKINVEILDPFGVLSEDWDCKLWTWILKPTKSNFSYLSLSVETDCEDDGSAINAKGRRVTWIFWGPTKKQESAEALSYLVSGTGRRVFTLEMVVFHNEKKWALESKRSLNICSAIY